MASHADLQKVLQHIDSILEGLCIDNFEDIYKDKEDCHVDYNAVTRELQINF